MADREPPYDPYIPSGGAAGGAGNAGGNQRTAALQAVCPFSLYEFILHHPPSLSSRYAWLQYSGGAAESESL